MFQLGEMQSTATNIFSAYASVAASIMLFRSIANDIVPEPVKTFFYSSFGNFFKHLFGRFYSKISNKIVMVVDEQTGITRNQIYDAADIYLRTKINPNTERLKVNKTPNQKSINISMAKEEQVTDFFNDFEFKWQFVLIEPDKERYQYERKYFELTFDKSYKEIVVNEYLPFVLAKSKEIKDAERAVKLYTRDCPYNYSDDEDGHGRAGEWGCINLDHPATFDKLAMDSKLKKSIIDDLDRFVSRKDYYKKVGKAWKRGYFLYGPPGTGKSSLIAAMANYLKFDVYDLELSSLYSNQELRRILLGTTNKSILVIEDIDCSSQMHNRDYRAYRAYEPESDEPSSNSNKLTLSGLLNFIDGLWSTCGDERIVIFTTNHKEKLDSALLRPGRMDMHIHMGYCTSEGFDVLAYNYLGIKDHPRLFPEIKGLIKEVEITPAEVAEHLMRNEDVELAIEGVLDLLKQKKDEAAAMNEESSTDNKLEKIKVVEGDEDLQTEKKSRFEKLVSSKKSKKGRSRKQKIKKDCLIEEEKGKQMYRAKLCH